MLDTLSGHRAIHNPTCERETNRAKPLDSLPSSPAMLSAILLLLWSLTLVRIRRSRLRGSAHQPSTGQRTDGAYPGCDSDTQWNALLQRDQPRRRYELGRRPERIACRRRDHRQLESRGHLRLHQVSADRRTRSHSRRPATTVPPTGAATQIPSVVNTYSNLAPPDPQNLQARIAHPSSG